MLVGCPEPPGVVAAQELNLLIRVYRSRSVSVSVVGVSVPKLCPEPTRCWPPGSGVGYSFVFIRKSGCLVAIVGFELVLVRLALVAGFGMSTCPNFALNQPVVGRLDWELRLEILLFHIYSGLWGRSLAAWQLFQHTLPAK